MIRYEYLLLLEEKRMTEVLLTQYRKELYDLASGHGLARVMCKHEIVSAMKNLSEPINSLRHSLESMIERLTDLEEEMGI